MVSGNPQVCFVFNSSFESPADSVARDLPPAPSFEGLAGNDDATRSAQARTVPRPRLPQPAEAGFGSPELLPTVLACPPGSESGERPGARQGPFVRGLESQAPAALVINADSSPRGSLPVGLVLAADRLADSGPFGSDLIQTAHGDHHRIATRIETEAVFRRTTRPVCVLRPFARTNRMDESVRRRPPAPSSLTRTAEMARVSTRSEETSL